MHLRMIYNQLIKSTIHLFGEVEANALYLKKNKRQNKKQKTLETVEFTLRRSLWNLYQPETEKKMK